MLTYGSVMTSGCSHPYPEVTVSTRGQSVCGIAPMGLGSRKQGGSQPQEGESVNTPLILSTLGIALFNGVKTII